MKGKDQSRALAYLFLFLTLTLPLQGCLSGCMDVTAGLNKATSQLLTLSVQEVKNIVAQLGNSTSQILGTAGEQTRLTINEATISLERLLKSLEQTTGGISKQVEGLVNSILSEVTKDTKELLALSDQIVRSNIKCLDEVMAKRMQQLCDNIMRLIDKLTASINDIVNNVFKNAQDFMKVGSSEVAILASKGVTMGLRALMLLFAMGLAIGLLSKNAHKTENSVKDYVTPFNAFAVLLIAGTMVLFLNPILVWIFLGYAAPVPFNKSDPKYEQICTQSNKSYSHFIHSYNTNPNSEDNLSNGFEVLDQLDKCAYFTEVGDMAARRKVMAGKINAILFPPPTTTTLALAECNTAPSVDPTAFSDRKGSKIMFIKEAMNLGELKFQPVRHIYKVPAKLLDLKQPKPNFGR